MWLIFLGLAQGLRDRPSQADELPIIDLRFLPANGTRALVRERLRFLEGAREQTEMRFFAERLAATFEAWRGMMVEMVTGLVRQPGSLLEIPEQQVRVKVKPSQYLRAREIVDFVTEVEKWRNASEIQFIRKGLNEFGRVFAFYKKELAKAIQRPCGLPSFLEESPSRISDNLNLRVSVDPSYGLVSVPALFNRLEDRRDVVEDNERQAVVRLTDELLAAGNQKIMEILGPASAFLQIPTVPELQRTLRKRLLEKSEIEVDFRPPIEDLYLVLKEIMGTYKLERIAVTQMNFEYLRAKSTVVSKRLGEMRRLICRGFKRS